MATTSGDRRGVWTLVPPLAAATLLACLFAAHRGLAQAPVEPTIEITSPDEDSYVSGRTTLRLVITPHDQAVERVSFYADGRLVCTLERPPFECTWDAGPGIQEHQVRAVVQLPGGASLRRVVRTREIALVETVDVDVVQVTAVVHDDDGRWVAGLPRESFRVLEDGVLQPITGFMSEDIPLEVAVAVDVSGSMTDAMPQVKLAVKKFLSALRPEDRVTLVAFNDNVFTLARPTADHATRLKAIDRLAAWGGTAFYEAIIKALDTQGRQSGRRALVVFTDGEDRHSLVPLARAEERLERSDSVLFPIGLGQGATSPALKAVLDRLARRSGGRAFYAERASRLDEAFSRIVSELSHQYLLGYSPASSRKDGAWREIRVEVKDKGLHVRARQGYRAAPR